MCGVHMFRHPRLRVLASCAVALGSVFDAIKTYLVFMMGLSEDEVRGLRVHHSVSSSFFARREPLVGAAAASAGFGLYARLCIFCPCCVLLLLSVKNMDVAHPADSLRRELI